MTGRLGSFGWRASTQQIQSEAIEFSSNISEITGPGYPNHDVELSLDDESTKIDIATARITNRVSLRGERAVKFFRVDELSYLDLCSKYLLHCSSQ